MRQNPVTRLTLHSVPNAARRQFTHMEIAGQTIIQTERRNVGRPTKRQRDQHPLRWKILDLRKDRDQHPLRWKILQWLILYWNNDDLCPIILGSKNDLQ
jgi:hypothetical protein